MLEVRKMVADYDAQNPELFMGIFVPKMYTKIFDEVIAKDLLWSGASIMFVLFYMWMHLESFFIAIISIFMVVLSFPMTQMIYTYVLQIPYNVNLN